MADEVIKGFILLDRKGRTLERSFRPTADDAWKYVYGFLGYPSPAPSSDVIRQRVEVRGFRIFPAVLTVSKDGSDDVE